MSLLISLLSPTGGGGGGDRYRGTWDASTNTPTLPNPPASPDYQEGDYYQVIAAGTQFGIPFTIGDDIVAVADGADLAWNARQGGTGNVTGPTSSTLNALPAFSNTAGDEIKNSAIIVSGAGLDKLSFADLNLSSLTVSTLLATDASKNLVSLNTSTYPSLTEISYVKGVTSAIQTQLNAKQVAITLAEIGSVPNAYGATLSAGTFTLQPASADFGGVITTGTQSFTGAKTITNAASGATFSVLNTTTSASNAGGSMALVSDDGSAMPLGARLGILQFSGATNDAHLLNTGAAIFATTTANWGIGSKGAKLVFNTSANGSAVTTTALTLNQDQSAIFANLVTATSLNISGLTIDTSKNITGANSFIFDQSSTIFSFPETVFNSGGGLNITQGGIYTFVLTGVKGSAEGSPSTTYLSVGALDDRTGSGFILETGTANFFTGDIHWRLNSDHSSSAEFSLYDTTETKKLYLAANIIDGTDVRLSVPYLTASTLTATDSNNNLQSLSTDTYPSLEEIGYVKGVTSSIQAQIDSLTTPSYAQEALSGTINGINTDFELSFAPVLNTQNIYINGVYQSLVSDYTISGTTITFVTPPQVGDTLTGSYRYGTSGSSTYAIKAPSGTINGINTIFTIAHTPLANTQSLYVNGLFQTEISDYALSGSAITFVTAPVAGDKLTITYQY